jgi:hypothetical protein
MIAADKIKFQVDEQYENEKGVFTVISMHRNEMVIQWENGEQIRTGIELQRTIQARRQWEEMNRRAKTKESAKRDAQATQNFSGFLPGDFKKTAAGTKWRGRGQLGGGVAALLPGDLFAFNSWALAQKPELHWLDKNHRRVFGSGDGARFFVRLTPSELIYGFCIPRLRDTGETSPHWKSFSDWVARKEGEHIVHTLTGENGLLLYDPSHPELGRLVPADGKWSLASGEKNTVVHTVNEFLENPAGTGVTVLEIARYAKKAAAVRRGEAISEDIGGLFSQLVPLYAAATAA